MRPLFWLKWSRVGIKSEGDGHLSLLSGARTNARCRRRLMAIPSRLNIQVGCSAGHFCWREHKVEQVCFSRDTSFWLICLILHLPRMQNRMQKYSVCLAKALLKEFFALEHLFGWWLLLFCNGSSLSKSMRKYVYNQHENYEILKLMGYGLAKFDIQFVQTFGFKTKPLFIKIWFPRRSRYDRHYQEQAGFIWSFFWQ